FRSDAADAGGETVLGQTTLQGHLAAFETGTNSTAAAGLLTFVTAAAGLAQAAADTTANAAAGLGAARCRAQCIQLHDLFLAFYRQHVANFGDEPAIGRSVQHLYALMHTTQTQAFQALAVSFHLPDGATDQSDLQLFSRHVS